MSLNAITAGNATDGLGQRLQALRRSFDDSIRDVPEVAASFAEPFLLITISGVQFGYPVTNALEVLQVPPIVPLPTALAALAGIINFRGRILTVSTLHNRLELEPGERESTNRIIVTKGLSPETGFLVDRVEGMTDVCADQIHALPSNTSDARARWLAGQVYLQQKPVFILTLDQWPGAIEAVAAKEGAK